MSGNLDDRIGEALRADAPAESDALFRLGVMERREAKRFRRRTLVLAAAGAMLAVVVTAAFSAGADVVATGGIALLGGAVIVAGLLSASGLREVMRRLGARKI